MQFLYLFLIGASLVLSAVLLPLWRRRQEQPQIPWLIALSMSLGLSAWFGVTSLSITDMTAMEDSVRVRQFLTFLGVALVSGLIRTYFQGGVRHYFTYIPLIFLVLVPYMFYNGQLVQPTGIREIQLPWGEVIHILDSTPEKAKYLLYAGGLLVVLLGIGLATYHSIVYQSRRHKWLAICLIAPVITGIISAWTNTGFPVIPLSNMSILVFMLVPVFQELAMSEDLAKELRLRKSELETLLFTLSHEMRSPLVNIGGFASETLTLLQNPSPEWSAKHREESIENLQILIQNTKRLNSIIANLLEVGRHSRDSLVLTIVQTDDLWKEACSLFNWAELDFDVVKHLPIPPSYADATRLKSVFLKILENCIAYRKPNVPGRILVSSTIQGRHLLITIQDDGIGIDPHQAEYCFSAFMQMNPDKSRHGMGLTLARLLLQRMGGTIQMTGSLGKGSIVTLKLEIKA